MSALDGIKWSPIAHVDKYSPELVSELTAHLGYEPSAEDFKRMSVNPSDTATEEGNLLTTAGLQRITNLIIGSGAAAFNASQGIIGVGATNTGALITDTTLAGNGSTTTAYYQVVSGAPTAVNGVITATTSYASGNANFAWNEWCLAVATGTITPGGTLASVGTSPQILNRKVASLGTKASGAVWVFTATVTLS